MHVEKLQLAWHCYQQQKQHSKARVLRWVQGILLLFMVTLSQTSANIQAYLGLNLANLLGADLVLSQPRALTASQYAELSAMAEQIVLTENLTTTLTHNSQWQRATLKAVAEDYPLQGELQSAAYAGGPDSASSQGPMVGEIWLDSRLLAGLGLQIGEQLHIGDQQLTVARVLLHEPDRLMEGHNVEMRALLHRADLQQFRAADDIIQHRYLVSANAQQIATILQWQKSQLPAAQLHHKHGAHPLALFWQRTENFIGLASVLLFFMAAIAMQQLSRAQLQQQQLFSAVCLSLGATKQTVLLIAVLNWLFGFLSLLPPVLALSALCHWLLLQWLKLHAFAGQELAGSVTALTWQPDIVLAVTAVVAGATIFFVFNLPLWLALWQCSVRQLIQPQQQRISSAIVLGCALLVLAAVALYYSDNALLSAMLLGAMAISITLLLALSWLVLSLGEKLSQPFSGLLPFALYMMKQRLLSKTTQVLGIGLAAFLLLFTLMLLKDLGDSMTAHQRAHDGNLLVSQASATQMAALELWAAQHAIAIRQHKPFMYAQLTHVNGGLLSDVIQKPSDSLATFSRPVRLHWSAAIPGNNRLVSGQWWQSSADNWQQLSVEQEVMTDLGLQLGDKLGLVIAGHYVEFSITATHAYKSGAGAITFWLQMPPAALAHISAPHYAMASLELQPQQFALLGELWQQHPTLRMVSLQELTQRFDSSLAMVTQLISAFAGLITLLASIVIVSSVQAVEAQEQKKNSIILSFGLSKRTCLLLNSIEWLVTGAVTAAGAIVATWLAGLLIYQSQFALPYQPDFGWLLATVAIILSLVTALGILLSKRSLSGSVRQLLAE
ncbi:MAG: permease [Gammaproteobacteria bacterium]|nr:permease [Gammaproteobacteria bacterium]MBU1554656.1 permease [Gammaproteobacteria bacterium]MBU2069119.1 permease [Gammaproteobacteria bacterium]MBU2182626.1 permease [Gammaproteobacteria bacterium]MBU2206553.1 permease [Gammaproteobacteria bacterium]